MTTGTPPTPGTDQDEPLRPPTIKRGVKIEPADRDTIDFNMLGILLARPRLIDEVEMQAWHSGYTQCPWCGHVGWTSGLNTDFYVNVVCGACGGYFRA